MCFIHWFNVLSIFLLAIKCEDLNNDKSLKDSSGLKKISPVSETSTDDNSSALEINNEKVNFSQEELESCSNNQGFRGIESCMKNCEYNKNYKKNERINSSDFVTHKVLYLKKNEYFLQNNTMHIMAWNITIRNDSFILISHDNARACLPLYDDFVTCDEGRILSGRIEYRDNGHTVWLRLLHKLFQWNEFFLYGDHIIFCLPEVVHTYNIIVRWHLAGAVLSALLLCLGLLLSRLIADLRQNISLQCHMAMMAIGFIILCCRILLKHPNSVACISISVLMHFAFMSAFFWMNVHAYDFYIAFSGNKKSFVKKFLVYSLVCWGLPLLIMVAAVIFEILEISYLQPGFGLHCNFAYGSGIAFAYYYGWISLSIFINIVIFILIVCKLRNINQEMSLISKKKLFILSIKLIFVMDFFWIFELLIWAEVGDILILSWLDISSSFQGVFIFLIYICRLDVIKNIFSKIKACCLSRQEGIEFKSIRSVNETVLAPDAIYKTYSEKISNL